MIEIVADIIYDFTFSPNLPHIINSRRLQTICKQTTVKTAFDAIKVKKQFYRNNLIHSPFKVKRDKTD